jgi:hypothetical protein
MRKALAVAARVTAKAIRDATTCKTTPVKFEEL